jgi:DNA modification methylase
VTIWKSPVVEMTRTKALGLLHKQLKKDSGRSRTGMPDYLLVFRKPGDNPIPITHTDADFPVSQWQEWASPVWMTVDQTNVLNAAVAREQKDEKHLCPLQLDVIQRALVLWSMPGDTVLSPFMGIGSEGVESIQAGRRFIGVELKEAYFNQAKAHIDAKARQAVLTF